MMKKLVSLTLCLMMCLAMALPANATVMSLSAASDGTENVTAAAAVGDLIYYLTASANGETLFSRTPDNAAATEIGRLTEDEDGLITGIDQLFAWNGKLYGVSLSKKTLFQLVDETGVYGQIKQDVSLDTSALAIEEDGGVYYATINSLFAMDDYLYYTARNYNQNVTFLAGRINLTTGEHKPFQTSNINCLAPYEDGKLIAYVYDMSALYGSDTTAAQEALSKAGDCAVFDPEKDVVENAVPIESTSQYGGMAIGGFCYGNGSVYFTSGSKVMGIDMATGVSRTSAYTGSGMFGGNEAGVTFYVAGYYVTFGYNGFSIYKLDSESLSKGALRIFGEMGSDAHKSFVKNYPDIPVEVGEDYTTDLETITRAMVSDTNPYDVLLLSLNYMPVDRLIKKGYCADLSAQGDVQALVSQMYPEFGEVMLQDGKLYGVPVDVSAYTYGVNMELWEQLGLTEDDLPTSLPELLDFAANWVYDYGEDNPDIYLFNYKESSMMLFSLILQDYMAYTQWKGESMLFDTPAYRDLLKAFEAVDFTEIDGFLDTDSFYVSADKALFSLYAPVVPMQYGDENMKPLYLSFVEGEESAIPAAMTVMIINPKSTRMDDAVLYMKNYLENLPKDGSYVTLFPEHNDPVEQKNYQQELDNLNEAIENAKARLETADPENKATIQDEIASLESSLEEAEKHRYTLTAEHIQNYRENIKPKLFVQRQNLLYSASNEALTEINNLMMQYLAKSIDADKMIVELDNRLRLMALEDN